VLGLYSLAVGEHQTGSYVLSTGGTRFLSVSSAIYMGSTVVLALQNFEQGMWGKRRYVHLFIAAIAGLAVVLSFARTTFVALVIVVPFVLWFLPHTRAWLLGRWKIWVPGLVVVVAAVAVALPSIRTTLVDRVTANPVQDHTVRWRAASFEAALTGFRSGEWRPPSPLAASGNQLMNPSFEDGTIGWFTQGGTIEAVPSNNPEFGSSALEFTTDGAQPDEGPFSLPVLSTKGQSWRLSIWLNGLKGGEQVSLGIWEYDPGGGHTGYTNFPLTLNAVPTHYFLTSTVTSPATAYVRAVIRTTEAEAITGYADRASLEPLNGSETKVVAHGRNYLSNSGFDSGSEGWAVQGGTMTPIGTAGQGASRALELRTDGNVEDEGLYSSEVPVHVGETWTFAMDLRGATPGQVASLALWQYDRSGQSVIQVKSPILLGTEPVQYRVSTSIADRRVKTIRALVRTVGDPAAIEVVADNAVLQEGSPHIERGQVTNAPPRTPGAPVTESLLGVGFGRSFNYMWEGNVYHLDGDPHNSLIWVLGGGGVLALFGLLAVLGAFLVDAIRRFRGSAGLDRLLLLWVLATWFLIMMTTLTEPVLSEPILLLSTWLVLLVPALALGRSGEHRRS
jgi:hypothetical protein